MNVIFLDFDGVLNTIHYGLDEDIEKRIMILSDICKEYDCKVVIEAALKDAIDEETLETYNKYVSFIFECFEKYNIECIGRTPNVRKVLSDISYIPMWKEDEIINYLVDHPEIEHFCIIDDNDSNDLEKVKDYLVETIYYSDNPMEEGLLERHKKEVGEKLKLHNKFRKSVVKKRK